MTSFVNVWDGSATTMQEVMHKNNALDYPGNPYPSDESTKQAIEDINAANPELKVTDREFTDTALLKEIEKEGFFTTIQC